MNRMKVTIDAPIKSLFSTIKAKDNSIAEDLDILESIEKAKQEWDIANSYFENVSDPELVDYAIYNVEAAQKRYVYLIRQAKALETAK